MKAWYLDNSLTSLSSGNAFVAGAEDLRFKFRAVLIGHSVATTTYRCGVPSKGTVLSKRNVADWGIRYTFRRNTASIMRFDFLL